MAASPDSPRYQLSKSRLNNCFVRGDNYYAHIGPKAARTRESEIFTLIQL